MGKKPKERAMAEKAVKTSLKLPEDLWREAHILALHERTDLQTVIADALRAYLPGRRTR
jgi:hypothetical protein